MRRKLDCFAAHYKLRRLHGRVTGNRSQPKRLAKACASSDLEKQKTPRSRCHGGAGSRSTAASINSLRRCYCKPGAHEIS